MFSNKKKENRKQGREYFLLKVIEGNFFFIILKTSLNFSDTVVLTEVSFVEKIVLLVNINETSKEIFHFCCKREKDPNTQWEKIV